MRTTLLMSGESLHSSQRRAWGSTWPDSNQAFFFFSLKLAPPDEELEVILVWRFHKGSGPGGVEAGLRRCPTLTAQLSGCGERGMKGRSVHGI